MKKILFLFVLVSFVSNAQFSIKGNLQPSNKYNWVLLYKVEGARQKFIKNASLKKSTKTVNGKSVAIGSFEFELPKEEKKGVYRITYDVQNNGFVDVFFNNENIELSINPNLPQIGVTIIASKENAIYQDYSNVISKQQYLLDSTQISYLKKPNAKTASDYKTMLTALKKIQANYETKSKNLFVYDFIKASKRYNSNTVLKTYEAYVKTAVTHFFDSMDFNNSNLKNSSFLVDRIADYVFYLNFANEESEKQLYYKRAINTSLSKISAPSFKADVIEFLTSQFATIQNTEIVNFLFESYYNKLPKENQNAEFKTKISKQLVTAIGNVAPDFSWKENGKTMKLSELSDGSSYLLIFYSTGCSHCLREVPQVYDFLKGKTKTKVVAFAMEEDDSVWKNYKKNLKGWHHVLGLGKWENKIARTYQINSTPTYFVLGSDKKIIANPERIEDLKKILNQLN